VRHAIGSLERPLSDEELRRKVHDLVGASLGGPGTAVLIERCLDLGGQPTLDALLDAAMPPQTPAA
jgi:hypothetical protein